MKQKIFFCVISALVAGTGIFQVKTCDNLGWLWWYAPIVIVWLLLLWIRPNYEAFRHDLGVIEDCDSPFKFEWGGTIPCVVIFTVLVVALIIRLIYYVFTTFCNFVGELFL